MDEMEELVEETGEVIFTEEENAFLDAVYGPEPKSYPASLPTVGLEKKVDHAHPQVTNPNAHDLQKINEIVSRNEKKGKKKTTIFCPIISCTKSQESEKFEGFTLAKQLHKHINHDHVQFGDAIPSYYLTYYKKKVCSKHKKCISKINKTHISCDEKKIEYQVGINDYIQINQILIPEEQVKQNKIQARCQNIAQ